MCNKIIKLIGMFFALALLGACGGGGGGGGAAPTLDGSWGGTVEDGIFNTGVITVTISGSNISGTSSLSGSFSGTITQTQGNIWGFTLSDGTAGGVMHDPSFTHAVFADNAFNFGVIQKGASGPSTTYVSADAVGFWSGTFAMVDSAFNLLSTGAANATVASDLTFTGSSNAGDSVSGNIANFIPAFGIWWGDNQNITSSLNGSGFAEVFLTADKNFAGSYACYSAWPAGCAFNMWNRQ